MVGYGLSNFFNSDAKSAKISDCFATFLRNKASYKVGIAVSEFCCQDYLRNMEEKEFLGGYEIKNWDFTPRIYKILGLSAVINFLIIFGLGQTNLLQTKACDSQYVGKVCQVLDTIYVGSKLFTGDTGYVVRDYQTTNIKDADVVWVDQTGAEPRFTYPPGYFYKEDQEAEALDDPMTYENPITPPINNTPITPPAPLNRGGGLFNTKPRVPKRNKKPVTGNVPDSLISREGDETNKNDADPKNDSPDKLPEIDGKTAKNGEENKTKEKTDKNSLENKTAKTSDPVKDLEINSKPLRDFANEIVVKWEKKQVDLSQQFLVRMNGEILENGRLNAGRSRFTEQKGNPEMINIAKRAIESV